MSATIIKLPNGRIINLNNGSLDHFKENLDKLGNVRPARQVWASPHIVMKNSYEALAHSFNYPGAVEEIEENIDFSTTIKIRKYLINNGFAIAEAMDTAQRFLIGWTIAKKLIKKTSNISGNIKFIAGASYDNISDPKNIDSICEAVIYQANIISDCGGIPIILPIPFLSKESYSSDKYIQVYKSLIDGINSQVYLHWLGEMFLPELKGYFPENSFECVMAIDREKILGVKLSLLDPVQEIIIRNKLANYNQVVLTGDDLNFCNMIVGDEYGFSHALLGIFDAIALPAGIAFQYLAHGLEEEFFTLMHPCEVLSRMIFEQPTQHYKAGLSFLSWLDGRQENSMLVNREDLCRTKEHFLSLVDQAAVANIFSNPKCVVERFSAWLDLNF